MAQIQFWNVYEFKLALFLFILCLRIINLFAKLDLKIREESEKYIFVLILKLSQFLFEWEYQKTICNRCIIVKIFMKNVFLNHDESTKMFLRHSIFIYHDIQKGPYDGKFPRNNFCWWMGFASIHFKRQEVLTKNLKEIQNKLLSMIKNTRY